MATRNSSYRNWRISYDSSREPNRVYIAYWRNVVLVAGNRIAIERAVDAHIDLMQFKQEQELTRK